MKPSIDVLFALVCGFLLGFLIDGWHSPDCPTGYTLHIVTDHKEPVKPAKTYTLDGIEADMHL